MGGAIGETHTRSCVSRQWYHESSGESGRCRYSGLEYFQSAGRVVWRHIIVRRKYTERHKMA